MIIKEIKIGAFGALKNLNISLSKGLNIIYGENEKGKTTIETFIKTMLYGFSRKKVSGFSDRSKYRAISGSNITGELIIENDGIEYIIKRSFGNTKKDDTSIILDALTGEEVKDINLESPGKSFLGINSQTFERTLFISQLGVAVTKDKEEEIIERITNIFGCTEEEVPAKNALIKLENNIKELTTSRGIGTLDLLKKKQASLIEERYLGYKIAEKNLDWENELYNEKNKKEELRSELNKLEVYKKYLKKVNLQKEYKDITEYLKKSEELKKQENEIQKNLEVGNEIIDEKFLDELKDENRIYLMLLDKKEELLEELNQKEIQYAERVKRLDNYRYLELLGDNIKDKLIKLKYEIQRVGEKLADIDNIASSIKIEEKELEEKAKLLGNAALIKNFKIEIEENLKCYEENLRQLSFLAQKNEGDNNIQGKIKKENIKRVGSVLIISIGIAICLLGFPMLILGSILSLIGAFILFKSSEVIGYYNSIRNEKDNIKNINMEVKNIEYKLNGYMEKVKVQDYKSLVINLKKYNLFKENEEKILLKIEEKKKLIDEKEHINLKNKYTKDLEMINSLKNISRCESIEEIVENIKIYEKLIMEEEVLEEEIESQKEVISESEKSINLLEVKIEKKLNIMSIDSSNILDVEIYIKEYREKLKKREDIHRNLENIEKTYKVLLKDRDIESIREELKDIINENNGYLFESQEEIEQEEKRKSNALIECEKNIKDIENNISTRLIGKRNIIEIEEELLEVQEKIKKGDRMLKALNIATESLSEANNEIRREIGPMLNQKISENFDMLTDGRYKEVKLADNYEMTVRDNDNIFKGSFLSNGAIDQLYLALRIALIELLFQDEECPVILDDAFVQYDDKRRKKALLLINNTLKGQGIIFTCQRTEEKLLEEINVERNIINL